MGGAEASPTKSTGVPCAQYLALVSLTHLNSRLSLFEDCKQKADVASVHQTIKDLKKPYGSLLGSVNAAKNELVRASQTLVKEMKAKQTRDKKEIRGENLCDT
eukprot:3029335-Amphidinium_carterae.1